MKKKVIIAVAFVAITAVSYVLMSYVHVLLGFIAIGLGIHILDKFVMGAE